jgi:hypothetical protein
MFVRTLWLLAAVTVAGGACKKKAGTSAEASSAEQDYVEKGVASLETALAKGDESRVLVECISASTSVERVPAALADKLRRLCYAEAPRLLLRNAVAGVKRGLAEHPDLADIECMQLLVSDAFELMAKQNPVDPEAQKLADEFTQLCPAEARKVRSKAAP